MAVREASTTLWWCLLVTFILIGVARFATGDVFGGIISWWMGYWAWHLTRGRCRRMTQHCVLLFGTMCLFELLVDIVNLLSCISGRSEEVTKMAPEEEKGGTHFNEYMVTVVRYSFFDARQGFLYNFQSVMMILITLSDLFGAFCSWYSYNCFTTSIFDDGGDEEDWGTVSGRDRMNNIIANVGGVNPARPPQQRFGAFEGESRRLED